MSMGSPPIGRLPPELLASLFETLPDEEKILCALACQRWRGITKEVWPDLKAYPDELLYNAAKNGSNSQIELAKKVGAEDSVATAIQAAAENGHKELLVPLRIWAENCYAKRIVKEAQAHNPHFCIDIAMEWNDYRGHLEFVLVAAARGGYPECMEVILDLVGSFNLTDREAIREASSNGHVECMKLLKELDFNVYPNFTLYHAAFGGHVDAMILAKKWGATKYQKALEGAVRAHDKGCAKLLKGWIAETNKC